MEAPRQRLLTILFAPPDAARRAAEQISSSKSWPDAFQTAERWNVAPQIAARMQELAVRPPADPSSEFKRALFATLARSAYRASKGAAALRHLEQSGIPAVAFKGLASMARLYAAPANRTIQDADILVEPDRARAAVDALAAIGFTPSEGHDLAEWERFLDHSPGFSGNKAISLSEPGGAEIDLHWSVGLAGLTTATLLARAETSTLFSDSVRVVSAGDSLILTARHAIRENLAVDSICRDLFDLRLSSAWISPSLENVAASQSVVPLLAIFAILDALAGPDKAVKEAWRALSDLATEKEKQSADFLEALFFYQVGHGAIGKDLVYLAHSRPLRQILSGAFTNWREYRRLMRSMEEKLDGGEVSLAHRAWRLALAVKNAGRAQWRGVRTLARLKYQAR